MFHYSRLLLCCVLLEHVQNSSTQKWSNGCWQMALSAPSCTFRNLKKRTLKKRLVLVGIGLMFVYTCVFLYIFFPIYKIVWGLVSSTNRCLISTWLLTNTLQSHNFPFVKLIINHQSYFQILCIGVNVSILQETKSW